MDISRFSSYINLTERCVFILRYQRAMDMKRTLSFLLVLITFSAMAFEFANGFFIGM